MKFSFMKGLLTGVMISIAGLAAHAQPAKSKEVPKDWHVMDPSESGFYGISVDKAYQLVKNKKSKTIIVAVIDSGVDTLHEDLKGRLWKNPKEIPGNGKDDDKNGYIDDINGWNFLGNADGNNVTVDSDEGTRVYYRYKSKFKDKTIDPKSLSADEKIEYEMWTKAKDKIEGAGDEGAGIDIVVLEKTLQNVINSDSILKIDMKKNVYTGDELDAFTPTTEASKKAKASLIYLFKANEMMKITNEEFVEGFTGFVKTERKKQDGINNPPKTYRADVVKDDESNINDRGYGNNNVMAGDTRHGTHVAGIIAANRSNNKGMQGIADNVKIMMLRAVPDGDEHDKDIALAIRYAVDNGAQVINMSFGKGFSPEKKWVDDAVKYADSKGVILVHAAGNDAKDIDQGNNFPLAYFLDGKTKAANWITVGASAAETKAGGLTAYFSNYGKDQVDVFAPGLNIYSTVPGGNTYAKLSGTSMASPVVAGLAAMVLSYYPDLSPRQVKYVIEKSAQMPPYKVKKPGTDEMVNLADISNTGGVINAFEAIKLAGTLKGERNKKSAPLPKPKMVKPRKG
jgi:cell wall-associated protease